MRGHLYSIAWEFLFRHGWLTLAMLALANVLPLFVIAALSQLSVDLDSPELVILPLALIPYNICIIDLAVLIAQGSISRFYLKPISNLSLTTVFFVSGGLVTVAGVVVSIQTWRLTFGIDWPVLRPAILTLSLWAGMHSLFRISTTTPARIAEVIGLVVFFWFWGMRFQPHDTLRNSPEMVHSLNWVDALLAIAIIVMGFSLSLHRIGCDRCGRTTSWLIDLTRHYMTKWDQRALTSLQFAGPQRAYAWYEWTLRGKPYVFCVLAMIMILGIANGISIFVSSQPISRSIADLREGIGSALLLHILLAGIAGFFVMLLNEQAVSDAASDDRIESDRRSILGEYRSSLPISDTQIANAILLSILKTVSMSVGSIAVVAIALTLLGTGLGNEQVLVGQSFAETSWSGLFVLLAVVAFGSWAAMANGATLAYISMRWRWVSGLIAFLICLFMIGLVYAETTLIIFGVSVLMLTCACFWQAYRSRCISFRLLCVCCVAVVLIGGLGWVAGSMLAPNVLSYAYAFGLLILASLTVLPLAAVPRVIADSRHM